MITYQRNGKAPATKAKNSEADVAANKEEEKGYRVNGMQQVIDMLRVADPAFRESLIKRLSAKNPTLGAQLRRTLAGLED